MTTRALLQNSSILVAIAWGLAGCTDPPPLPSSYVRVTAHLLHGDEPIAMDWVVECGHTARSGEMRAYVRQSVVPYVYGVATRDGGMVLAVAPGYCGLKKPVTDYLPLFYWGDKAGDFSFLTAYATEDAFTNPASKLKVVDVTLLPATAEDRETWKRTGAKNIVPAQHNPFIRNPGGTTDERRVGCGGFERIPVLPSVQAMVDAAWPPDHPQYWPLTSMNYLAIQYAFHREINATFLNGSGRGFSDGLGAIRRPAANDPAHPPFKAYDVIPIDFDFFHKDVDEYNLGPIYVFDPTLTMG